MVNAEASGPKQSVWFSTGGSIYLEEPHPVGCLGNGKGQLDAVRRGRDRGCVRVSAGARLHDQAEATGISGRVDIVAENASRTPAVLHVEAKGATSSNPNSARYGSEFNASQAKT